MVFCWLGGAWGYDFVTMHARTPFEMRWSFFFSEMARFAYFGAVG
jgi:hypothetical protein